MHFCSKAANRTYYYISKPSAGNLKSLKTLWVSLPRTAAVKTRLQDYMWSETRSGAEQTDLYALKSSSLSLKPLLRSMLIPLSASSASSMRSVFCSSAPLRAGSAVSAIEISDAVSEELERGRGGRLQYLCSGLVNLLDKIVSAGCAVLRKRCRGHILTRQGY